MRLIIAKSLLVITILAVSGEELLHHLLTRPARLLGELHASIQNPPRFPEPNIILGERSVSFLEHHPNPTRSFHPDSSDFPADFNDLPIKTGVFINGEDITIYALKREHVDKAKPILKYFLCG